MTRSHRTNAACLTAAVALASCSGGGAASHATPRVVPSSSGKAQANITIRYTEGLHRLKTRSGRRSPRFVDPAGSSLEVVSYSSTNPSFQITTAVAIAPGVDGTQSVTVPILSSPGANDATFVGVLEVDTNSDILAEGEGYLTSVQPGSLVTPGPLTLYMIPAGIGITTDPSNGGDAVALSTDQTNPTVFTPNQGCPGTAYLFAFDATGAWSTQFGTALGQGGIPTPQIFSQQSDGINGTSRLTTVQGGGFVIVRDSNGDGVTAHLQTYVQDPLDPAVGLSNFDAYVDFKPPSC